MELRKVRGAGDARTALAAAAASGLPRRDWARANGISPRSLNMWRLILARADPPRDSAPLRLVELTPLASPVWPTYTVLVGDFRIEVGDDFRGDTLVRLLGVLRAC